MAYGDLCAEEFLTHSVSGTPASLGPGYKPNKMLSFTVIG
jgi:hypothetical protein